MLRSVYRPSRFRNGRRVVSRVYRGRFRLEPEEKLTDVGLGTSDKRIAEQRLAELIREREHERAGIVPPKRLRDGAQRLMTEHLGEFLADVGARGRTKTYVRRVRQRVRILVRDCGWEYPKDVTADSFMRWRASQCKAARTLNHYVDAARVLLNWMMAQGRIAVNPLGTVEKVDVRGKQTFERRALSDDEVRRLLAVCGPRRVVYLMAVQTGLRWSELRQLRWGDVELAQAQPFVRVRASTTKNRRRAILPLVGELVMELRAIQPEGVDGGSAVFCGRMPRRETVKKDFERAGIVWEDSENRRADFHALRHTFITNMGRAGVGGRIAMEAARHSDQRLTDRVYTDASRLPMVAAFAVLPRFLDDSHIDSHILDATGHDVAQGVSAAGGANGAQVVVRKGTRREESRLGISSHSGSKTGGGGNRNSGPAAKTAFWVAPSSVSPPILYSVLYIAGGDWSGTGGKCPLAGSRISDPPSRLSIRVAHSSPLPPRGLEPCRDHVCAIKNRVSGIIGGAFCGAFSAAPDGGF